MYSQNQAYPGQPGYGGYPPQQGGYPPQQYGFPPPQASYPPPFVTGPVASSSLPNSGGAYGSGPIGLFAEKPIRQAFISKVYSILTMQLVFTSVLIGTFVLNDDAKMYFANSPGYLLAGLAIFLVSYLTLACVESLRRSTPCNMILLCILTFGYGLFAATLSCAFDTRVVMYAFVATAVSCFLLAVFAKTTSFDMTSCGTILCLIAFAHLVISMLMVAILVPLGYADPVHLILSVSGALLASLYLVFNLQNLMGGRKCELSPEEYILAAIMLYVDIMQIFVNLLELSGRLSK